MTDFKDQILQGIADAKTKYRWPLLGGASLLGLVSLAHLLSKPTHSGAPEHEGPYDHPPRE